MTLLEQELNLGIRKGILLPTTALSRILNGKTMIEELDKESIKSRIYTFMEAREKITISDIVDNFNLEPEQAIKLLEEMEKEKKIRQV